MTKSQITVVETKALEQALIDSPDYLRQMITVMIQEVLEEEITAHLGAAKHERSEERVGQRNGYKPRMLTTRVGKLTLAVPQARDGSFSTELFSRYQRSEKALVLTLTEMYLKGVSTRKIADITEKLCGISFSKTQVSSLSKKLDAEIAAWKSRPLGVYPYLVIDARYEKVRSKSGVVQSQGVLIVMGIRADGFREIIDVVVADTENRASYSELFANLKK